MGWRDRDWAKWSDDEFKRFYGSSDSVRSTSTGAAPPWTGGRTRRRRRHPFLRALFLLLIAVLVTCGLMGAYAAGVRLPSLARNRAPAVIVPPVVPIVTPAPAQPAPPRARYFKMTGPTVVPRGSYMTSSGTLTPGVSGPVIVEGRWGSGRWYRLATTNATNGAYRVRYLLANPGVVHVRLALPDGNFLVATIHVT
jgi:hypothetical protein